MSLASHTPPTPSSLPSPAIGGAQEKPIAIRSSPAVVSSQNKSFVVQSSQSDERVESEEEIEEGDDTVLADDPQRSKRVQQQLDGTKPTIQDLDGDSDSDSSLEDLDAMLNRNRKKQERPPTPPATTSARSKRTGAFKGSYDVPQTFENILSKANETSAAKATPTPQYRYSLAKLVKQHKKGEQRRTAMEEAEAASKAREQHALAVNVDAGELDKDVLASVVKEEDGESSFSKVLQALERADVMTKQVEYHFFDWHLETPELKSPGRLRLEKAPPEVVALFEDGPARDECFLNGFAAELALTDVFGEQNRPWLLQRLWEAAIGEPREDLSQAYLEAGKILSTHADFAGWIQPHHVEETFRRCSASASAIDRKQNERLLPNHGRSGKAPYHRHARLLRTLHVLEHTAQSLSPNSVSYTLGVLLRLAADTQIVKKDVEVQMALQRAFAALFEQILSDENGTRRVSAIQAMYELQQKANVGRSTTSRLQHCNASPIQFYNSTS